MQSYDIITVGGGLGGSALAKAMAERGARVLVVEREAQFKDRVRGEALAPWGVAEAKELGLFDLLSDRCGHMLRYWTVYAGGNQVVNRDFFTTTLQKTGWLTFYHPEMQEAVLEAVETAGAEVRRGSRVRGLEPGAPAQVTLETERQTEEVEARLVVAADGRSSAARKWAGFESNEDPPSLLFAGVLFENVRAPRDVFYHVAAPGMGFTAYVFPQRDGRSRCYFGWHKDTQLERLQGSRDVARFREASERIGMPKNFYAEANAIGPLATFDGRDSWVEHPYKNAVALIGDAAATSDPTWGQGMSLTLRDARVLRDCLLRERDWDKAGHAYAAEHDRYYDIIHRCDGWAAEVFMAMGAETDAIRARALPLLAEDPSRFPESPHSGPEAAHDERARRRFYGEE